MNGNNTVQKIYVLSGLGADKRVFQNIDFAKHDVTYIDWIAPLPNESIDHYASRLTGQFKTINPIIIGLSFGGIMAIEIAKQINAHRVIIIASAKNRKEIPYYYKLIGFLKLYRLVPTILFKTPSFITYYAFGASSAEEKSLLRQILKDTDSIFLKWAIDAILKWQNMSAIKNLIHIHGTNDKTLPIKYTQPDIVIHNGSHFMTLNKAKELSSTINHLLSNS